MTNETQIFGDGKSVVFIFKQTGRAEMSYTFKNPILHTVNVTQGMLPEIDEVCLGSKVISGMQVGSCEVDVTLSLKCRGEDMTTEYSNKGGLFHNLDMFKNVSVSKMFKIINKKLKKRDKEF